MDKQKSNERVRAFRERAKANRPLKKPPKSGLERVREYRARKKTLKMRFDQLNPDVPSTSPDAFTEMIIDKAYKTKLKNRERARRYRERQRAQKAKRSPKKPAKSVLARVREYRARKKALKVCSDQVSYPTASNGPSKQCPAVPSSAPYTFSGMVISFLEHNSTENDE